MIIGNLNELLGGIECRVTLADNPTVPPIEREGNPLRGESFAVKWSKMWDMGLDFHFLLPKAAFIDRLTLRLGEETRLFSAQLLNGDTDGILSTLRGETGKTLTERELVLEGNALCRHLILRVDSDLTTVILENALLTGAVEEGVELFPTADSVVMGEGSLKASEPMFFFSDTPLSAKAEAVLSEKYKEVTGFSLLKRKEAELSFGLDAALGPNAYRVEITKKGASLSASDERGFVMAVETLLKLYKDGAFPCLTVEDAPAYPFRGMHIYLPSEEEMPFAKRMVKYLLSPMGYNAVIVELCGAMEYKSHPEINAAYEEGVRKGAAGELPRFPHGSVGGGRTVTQETVKDFVAYVRSFGITPIPEVQSLGHVQFMTFAHPEIAEIPVEAEEDAIDTRTEDARPERIYPHCYCPSNEKSYEILFDLLDEIIEVFEPDPYVHMGHDEVYEIGVCKVCRTKDPAELFAADVNRIYDYLKKKGLKMMIWADMLQPVTKYKTPAAIRKIPKDIVMLDFIWYFHMEKDIEDNLLKEGFQVGIGNLYSSHFPRYLSRITKPGMIGGQISGWVGMNPIAQAKEGKFFDYFLTAQMLWSKSYSPAYHNVYKKLIAPLLPALREKLEEFSYPSLQKDAELTELLCQEVALPPVKGQPLQREVAVNEAVKSVLFSVTMLRKITRKPWTDNPPVGELVLSYEDGSQTREVLAVGKNVFHWNRRFFDAFHHGLYRHNGYTANYHCTGEESRLASGEPVCFYRVEVLADPEKKLVKAAVEEYEGVDARIALGRLAVVKA